MKTNIGTNKNARNSVLKPANYGMSEIAQARLDQVVGMANRRHLEALTVDGMDAFVWLRTFSGSKCTCQSDAVLSKPFDVLNKPEQANNLAATNLESDESLSDGTGAPLATDKSLHVRRVRGAADLPAPTSSNELLNIVNQIKRDNSTANNGFDNENDQDILDSILQESTAGDPLGEDEDAAFASQKLTNGLAFRGGDKNSCGICFGTGYTNGYNLHKGQRFILDNSDAYASTLSGFEVDTQKYPNSFKGQSQYGSYVEFQIQLPRYFQKFLQIAIRNNTEGAPNLKTMWTPIGVLDWQPLSTLTFLPNARNGQNNNIRIRVVPTNVVEVGKESMVEFTHVELTFQYADMPKLQMPQVNSSEDYSYFEPLVNSTGELSAEIPNLDRYAVISENRQGNLWKVTDITSPVTRKGQLFNLELTLRMIHKFEILYLLNVYRDLTTFISFRGLEKYQGGINEGEVSNTPVANTRP